MKDTHSDEQSFLEELELSVRLVNVLKGLNITTLEQVSRMSEKELILLPKIGKVSIAEIKEILDINGMSLSDD